MPCERDKLRRCEASDAVQQLSARLGVEIEGCEIHHQRFSILRKSATVNSAKLKLPEKPNHQPYMTADYVLYFCCSIFGRLAQSIMAAIIVKLRPRDPTLDGRFTNRSDSGLNQIDAITVSQMFGIHP
jgi:hypothetical protein